MLRYSAVRRWHLPAIRWGGEEGEGDIHHFRGPSDGLQAMIEPGAAGWNGVGSDAVEVWQPAELIHFFQVYGGLISNRIQNEYGPIEICLGSRSQLQVGKRIAEKIALVPFTQMKELAVRQIGIIRFSLILSDFFFCRSIISIIQRFFRRAMSGAVFDEGWVEGNKCQRNFNDVSLPLFPHARAVMPSSVIVLYFLLSG